MTITLMQYIPRSASAASRSDLWSVCVKDVWQIIYNYSDIVTLSSLSSTCRNNYLYADRRYYQKRVELYFLITKLELQIIIPYIHTYCQNKSRINNSNYLSEKHHINIHYYSTFDKIFQPPDNLGIPKLYYHIESKSLVIYTFLNKVIKEYKDKGKFPDVDKRIKLVTEKEKREQEKHAMKLIKKLIYGIRYNYFRAGGP